jgi:signal transduction histidine kinase
MIDASTLINLNQSVTRSTLIICGVGLIITFLAVLALSGRIVQPEIENARRQKMFITNASHELKTPLAVIRANTELEELINGETEWTHSTLRQVDRLNGLIQNLVMIARAQEAEDPGTLTDVDASAAIIDTVRPYESLARQEGKTLSLDVVPDLHMTADESRLRQLAAILVDNAFKYCDEKGDVSVAFSRTRIGRQMSLTVSNSYAAGKDVDYSRFFERFYREDTSHNTNREDRGGFGIGLSIAESICNQYKGTIRASWKDGIITFTCLLG